MASTRCILVLLLFWLLDCLVFLVYLWDLGAQGRLWGGVPHQRVHVAARHGVHVVAVDWSIDEWDLPEALIWVVEGLVYLVVVDDRVQVALVAVVKEAVVSIPMGDNEFGQVVQVVLLLLGLMLLNGMLLATVDLLAHAH